MMERERKYCISEQEYIALKKVFNTQEVLQTNFYFTDKESDFMTRIRLKNGKYVLTAKIKCLQENGLFVAEEINADITKEQAERFILNGLPNQIIKEYLSIDIPFNLYYVGKLDTYRSKINYKNIVLELDKSLYFNVVDYELECEIDPSDEGVLSEFLTKYFAKIPAPSALPKFKRFLKAV